MLSVDYFWMHFVDLGDFTTLEVEDHAGIRA
jgi:hypothetical protein